MSGKSIRSRPVQIAELTRGQILPLSAISDTHMEVIAETLAREWGELVKRYSGELDACDEVELNSLVCSRLNSVEDQLWTALVSNVVRDHSVISYDGSHLEKSPDLSIHLTHRPASFRLEVECKLIDRANGKTVGLYLKDGLARFLKGEYAWAVREAFMLAYVRDGSVVADTLTPVLQTYMQTGSDPYRTETLPQPVTGHSDLARSTHSRVFSYVHGGSPSTPGAIAIWHLWL